LAALTNEGQFREDCYYRLNVVRIALPPLRERRSDVPTLAGHFVQKFSDLNAKPVQGISREAMDLLIKYHYPGNVRELENIIEQAVVLCREDLITTQDLPRHLSATATAGDVPAGGSLQDQVEALEIRLIRTALAEAEGNQSRAAKSLGMSERHLRYKLKKYELK